MLQPSDMLTRAKELEIQAAENLQKMGGVPCRAEMAVKLPPGKMGQKGVKLTTNIYGLPMRNIKAYRYEVEIFATTRNGAHVDFTTGGRDDASKVEQKRRSLGVFQAFYMANANLFGSRYSAYDLSKIFYTSQPLEIPQATGNVTLAQIGQSKTFPEEESQKLFGRFQGFNIQLKAATGRGFEIDLSDIQSAITNKLEEYNRTLLQYLDIYTAQWAMINPGVHVVFSSSEAYLIEPMKFGYNASELPFFRSNNSFLSAGYRKDACFVEGPKGHAENDTNYMPAVVISSKKTPFHCSTQDEQGNLMVKAKFYCTKLGEERLENGVLNRLENILKGLVVETTYSNQRVKIAKLSRTTAEDSRFSRDGIEISVKEYFGQFGYEIHFPLAPLIMNQKGNFYPMEYCNLVDNQKVKMNQMTPDFSAEMIRACAVEPAKLIVQNEHAVESLNLKGSEILAGGGIDFVPKPLALENARILAPPTLQYGNEVAKIQIGPNTWRAGAKLLNPSGCSKFVVLVQYSARVIRGANDEADLREFFNMFTTEARRLGMRMPDPEFISIRPERSNRERGQKEEAQLVTEQIHILAASQQKPDFVLVVQHGTDELVHDSIKLEERKSNITTQVVLWDTVLKVARKKQRITLQNVLYKTNVKLRGLNYCLAKDEIATKVQSKRLLIIGVGVSHFVRQARDSTMEEEQHAEDANGTNGANGGNGHGHNGENGENGINGANGHNGGNGTNGGNGHGGNGSNGRGSPTNGVGASRLPFQRASVVGFAANTGTKEFAYVGDFMIQEPYRQEKPDAMFRIVDYCVEKFTENRQVTPTRIIIYRHGTSEGEYEKILKYEVAFIKEALKQRGCLDAKLAIIVVNKRHNVRFFRQDMNPRDKASEQNIRPGTVIDEHAVHPVWLEFYLNAHRALQGTASTPRFTVLLNEDNMSMDTMEGVTNYLCYGHQIVNSPTSLPSPLQIANLYADRGRRVYACKLASDPAAAFKTYDELERDLCYRNTTEFADRRINA